MKDKWKLEDLIDLDYFARLDREKDDENGKDLHTRDRQVFLDISQQEQVKTISHTQCLGYWLQWQRGSLSDTAASPPGSLLHSRLGLFHFILLFTGLTAGAGLGGSYFAYSGTTPLNVFTFFTLFILPQLILVALLLFRSAVLSLMGKPLSHLNNLTRSLFSTLLHLSGKRAQLSSDFLATMLKSRSVPLQWPLFIAGQWFGIAFNAGLVLVTLFKVATADLAFGWQTTLQFGPEALLSVVNTLASPWSWLLPQSLSAPTLEQIEGSRIILKDGIQHLLTEDLTSWWPFLLMSLILYGLIPRIVLLTAGFRLKNRSFSRFLNQRKFHTISRRMLLPLVTTQGEEQQTTASQPHVDEPHGTRHQQSVDAVTEEALVLLPVDIAPSFPADRLEKMLSNHGYAVEEKQIIFDDYDEDRQLLAHLKGSRRPIVLLLEAWMAPIGEQLDFISQLAANIANTAPLSICLLGKPSPGRPINVPSDNDKRLWKKRIDGYSEGIMYLDIQPDFHNEES